MPTTTAAALGLLTDLRKGNAAAYAAALDMLEEVMPDATPLRRFRGQRPSWYSHEVEALLAKQGLFSYEDLPEQKKARAFQAAVAAVDLLEVGVVSYDRSICRKEQARLARDLFKRLGLKGASITAPNYSMASTVDVQIPRLEGAAGAFGSAEYENDPIRRANCECDAKVKAILAAAFPNHNDRSRSIEDYFDAKWSIN